MYTCMERVGESGEERRESGGEWGERERMGIVGKKGREGRVVGKKGREGG